MQAEVAEIAREAGHRAPRAELHGPRRPDTCRARRTSTTCPRPAPRRDGRRSPSRAASPNAFVNAGHADRLEPDHQLRLGGRPRPLRLPRRLPGRPGDRLGRPVRRGLQAARSGSSPSRIGRWRWTCRSSRSRSGGARRRRPPRSRTPARSPATRARPRPRCAPRASSLCDDLDELLEAAALVSALAPARAARRAGQDRRRHRLDRRGLADRRPRAAARPGPAARSRPARGRRIAAALPTLTPPREPARPVGRGRGRADLPRLLRGLRRLGRVRRRWRSSTTSRTSRSAERDRARASSSARSSSPRRRTGPACCRSSSR